MNTGWISVQRKIMGHWIWENERIFSYLKAWIYLLMKANHKSNNVLFRNNLIRVRRGEHFTSETQLAAEWHWNRKTVHKFLDLLAKDKMISITRTHQYTSYYIINYDTYQSNGTAKRTTNEQQNVQQNEQHEDINNNNERMNKNEEEDGEKIAEEVMTYAKSKKGWKVGKNTLHGHISFYKSLIKKGYTINDFKKSIDDAYNNWINNSDKCKVFQVWEILVDYFNYPVDPKDHWL